MTALQAVKNAIALLPPGQVRKDLAAVARLINYQVRPGSAQADTGATIIRFDERDRDPFAERTKYRQPRPNARTL